MVMPQRLRITLSTGMSVTLIALILGLNATHAEGDVGPSAPAYFVALCLPQAVITLMLRKGPNPSALAVTAGVAFLMTLFSVAWSAVGYIMAAANFGGYRPPDWYWIQWFAGCVVMVAQFIMGCFAFVSLCRLTSTRRAVAQALGGLVVAFLYAVIAFTVLRLMA
jgi:hypothetical protein